MCTISCAKGLLILFNSLFWVCMQLYTIFHFLFCLKKKQKAAEIQLLTHSVALPFYLYVRDGCDTARRAVHLRAAA